jgi:prepilin-type N-terminal cleavage/methylation domain-containing protein
MKKMNKKGFTLIEMLVVIAIIAVLVSIIIPTVSSATGKAKAATDAANLRSMLAEATTDYLNGQSEGDTNYGLVKLTVTETDGVKTYTFNCTAGPESKSVTGANGAKVYATIEVDDNGTLTARYNNYMLSDFQKVAENGGTLTGTYVAPGEGN